MMLVSGSSRGHTKKTLATEETLLTRKTVVETRRDRYV